jgi:hypothetical protein
MKKNEFYQKFEKLPKEARFALVETSPTPTSFFVIFQQLSQVRAQQRYFEQREEELLQQAEEAFNKLETSFSEK